MWLGAVHEAIAASFHLKSLDAANLKVDDIDLI